MNKLLLAMLIALSLGSCAVYSMNDSSDCSGTESCMSQSSDSESSDDERNAYLSKLVSCLSSAVVTPDSGSRDVFGQESNLIEAVLNNNYELVKCEVLKLFKQKQLTLLQRDPIQEIQSCIQIARQKKIEKILNVLVEAKNKLEAIKKAEEVADGLRRLQEKQERDVRRHHLRQERERSLKNTVLSRKQKKV